MSPLPFVVITPVFEDSEASTHLFHELFDAFGGQVHVVAVDDGSVRQPVDIAQMEAIGLGGTVIRLRRNVGHQRAIAVGLGYVAEHLAEAQRVVVMDSDGEDLPASIPELLQTLDRDEIDVVVAERRTRVETLRFKLFYTVYRRLFKLLTGRSISFGNFMGLKPHAVKRLAAMQELWTHVASCVLGSRLRIAICALDRGPRYAGQSKMNFVGLTLHGFRGIMVFAEDVLVRVGIAAALLGALTLLGGIASVVLKVSGYATPGWFSVALGILLLVFLQTGTLALMSLMLTGVSRSGASLQAAYTDFVDTVTHTGRTA
ncbi:putative glycosyltransferase YkoT [Variovorax sp. PBL-H6]|uniref:glycosyltransferase n=1 Tax=Variovorax sp. PBL-H6 TaxID=434009 RepID=UPI0013188AE1|nr:glycosyltransferase [Variovorax sp. PBL-H6]VTU17334.1 putative glycosyltransferase YkoT [Variovorax sp. PBL-H6]